MNHIIKQEPVRGPTPVKIFDAFPIHGVFALECAPCSDFVTRDMKVCVKVVVAWFGERGICGARTYQTEERWRSAVKE